MPAPHLVLITGAAGAGLSSALRFFEDAGCFAVDNLPAGMLSSLAVLAERANDSKRSAVTCDVRSGESFKALPAVLYELEAEERRPYLVFLECDEQELINRYKLTRRQHPLSGTRVLEGIRAERESLAPLKEEADLIIDTSDLSPLGLRKRLSDELMLDLQTRLSLTFNSFGYKYGPPTDADLTFDVRFLPNPHWDEQLRALTGRDQEVAAYVARDGRLEELLSHLYPLLDHILPNYADDGRSQLVVAIGCTGGRHRSVAIAEQLAQHYRQIDGPWRVEVQHRDIHRADQ